MPQAHTLLQKFYDQVHRFGATRPALKQKCDGAWRSWSWTEYGEMVGRVAAGLEALGFAAGDKINILSTNRPEWLFADLAAMARGGVSAGIYPNDLPDQVEYIAGHSEARVLFVDTAGQLAKTDSFRDSMTTLEKVVVICPDESVREEGKVIFWETFLANGEGAWEKNAARFEEEARVVDAQTFCMMVYTSGTTGRPKGAMYSHKNIIFEGAELKPFMGTDCLESISFLPLCHIAERLQGEIVAILAGNTVWFAQSIEKLKDNLIEVQPTVLLCVPRLWEKFYAGIQAKFKEATGLKKTMIERTLKVGGEVASYRNSNRPAPPLLHFEWTIWNRLVVSKLKAALGLARCQVFISGAAPLSGEIARFFGALGMDIIEVYGQTECVGVSNANAKGALKYGTVGRKMPHVEVKIAQDGEILVRGDNVFLGYYKAEEATAETIVDGWLLTGDIGEFDEDGFLKITDRKKDIIVTAGGKNVAPQNIENRLKLFPGLSQAVVLGDKKKFLVALFTLDPLATKELCAASGVPETDDLKTLSKNEKVRELIAGYIDKTNSELARYESIKEFRILDHDFTVESGEITPTMKIKRRVIQKRYEELINSMYPED